MPDRDTTLLYLLYGGSREYHLELTYSVLSAARNMGPEPITRIVLLTDERTRRDDLPVERLVFSDAEFGSWTDDGAYKHAAKIGGLEFALRHYGGKVAIIDTDTFFTDSPRLLFERIGDGSALMNAAEGTLGDRGNKWDRIFAAYESIEPRSKMYNSGVIGVDRSMGALLADVRPLMMDLHSISPEIHDVEQFAVTHLLGASLRLNTCEDVLCHYWGYARRFVHARIEAQFPSFSEETFKRALLVPSIDAFPAKQKRDLIRSKLKGLLRRETDTYAFAYLAYLSSFHAKCPAYANAWSAIAVDALTWNPFSPNMVRADFERMQQISDDDQLWLSATTRERWRSYWANLH